ncbi:hypothetical protein NBRC116594_38340 [Shimia sp. NS0008-38b]
MLGSCAATSGVIDVPTATPKIVRAPAETSPNPTSLIPPNAANKQAIIGPNRNGNGNPSAQNTKAPMAATTKVRDRCRMVLMGDSNLI